MLDMLATKANLITTTITITTTTISTTTIKNDTSRDIMANHPSTRIYLTFHACRTAATCTIDDNITCTAATEDIYRLLYYGGKRTLMTLARLNMPHLRVSFLAEHDAALSSHINARTGHFASSPFTLSLVLDDCASYRAHDHPYNHCYKRELEVTILVNKLVTELDFM